MARLVVLNLKAYNENVSYVKEAGALYQFLNFSGEEVGSPYAKFALEPAKSSGNGGLVNIRCCYNNKYWAIITGNWIGASAEEPDEDVTKGSCTLFEPFYVDVAKTTVRFRHAQNKYFLGLRQRSSMSLRGLAAGFSTSETAMIQIEFEAIDLETLVIFPKYVAFKGDNGNYLGGVWTERHEYHQYSTTDIGSNRSGYEIFPTPNRSVRIKSNFYGKFWRRSPNWIWADSTDTSTNDPDTLFLPIKVSNNVVALRNMGNNQFCSRLTTEGKTNCLNASGPTISQLERMEVEELVLSRTITNVVYRLTDSRIYDEDTLAMANGVATNRTTEPNTMTIKFTYTESWSKVWNTSVSMSVGFKYNVKWGVPSIISHEIEISTEISGEYAWGESEDTTKEMAMEYAVTVPPMTTVRVGLLATRGTCDVPFSYSQRDTLFTGEHIIFAKDDGVFTGINCYNYKFESTEEKL